MLILLNYRAARCAACEQEEPDARMVVDVARPGERGVPLCLRHLQEAIRRHCTDAKSSEVDDA